MVFLVIAVYFLAQNSAYIVSELLCQCFVFFGFVAGVDSAQTRLSASALTASKAAEERGCTICR